MKYLKQKRDPRRGQNEILIYLIYKKLFLIFKILPLTYFNNYKNQILAAIKFYPFGYEIVFINSPAFLVQCLIIFLSNLT